MFLGFNATKTDAVDLKWAQLLCTYYIFNIQPNLWHTWGVFEGSKRISHAFLRFRIFVDVSKLEYHKTNKFHAQAGETG